PLVVIDDRQRPRAEREDLAGELAADRAAAAGHEDAGAVQVGGADLGIDADRFAAEEVLQADWPNLRQLDLAADELAERRDRSYLEPEAVAALERPADRLARGGRHRDHQELGAGPARGRIELVEPAEDALAQHPRVALPGLVVEEADDAHPRGAIPSGEAGDGRSCLAGAVDQGRDRRLVMAIAEGPIQTRPQEETAAAQEGQVQEGLDEEHRAREAVRAGDVQHGQHEE